METEDNTLGPTIVQPTALGPVANTDTKLLIYGLFQKGRVLAQDGVAGAALSLPLWTSYPPFRKCPRNWIKPTVRLFAC